ncbi:hypothetical protein PR202_ga17292 [Eleusine coracana subsp. coracana]|uniref:FBD domain-containing protein n=1 Tax=Eleusine coracana subsp. coracana TaxID=191504 RepID=A0AAV5CP11_ELECO|nr:hypothetical protein PR202_ga17292 [Eleusine coracana subsp. coracana]
MPCNLKTVVFKGYTVTKSHIKFATLFVLNAKKLKVMRFGARGFNYTGDKKLDQLGWSCLLRKWPREVLGFVTRHLERDLDQMRPGRALYALWDSSLSSLLFPAVDL